MALVYIKTSVLDITHEDQEVLNLRFNVIPTDKGDFFIEIESDNEVNVQSYIARVGGTPSSKEELDAYIASLPQIDIPVLPSDLELAKEFKLKELSDAVDNAVFEGFASSIIRDAVAVEFSFNERYQSEFLQQVSIILANGGFGVYPYPIQWKTKNAGVVTLTATEFVTVVNEAAVHKKGKQERFWNLEKQVLAAGTVEELATIAW